MTDTDAVFQAAQLDQATTVLHALAHPLRLRLVKFVRQEGGASVQSICQELDIEQSLASQQLRVLRMAGLASSDRKGKYVNYKIDETRYATVSGALQKFLTADRQHA